MRTKWATILVKAWASVYGPLSRSVPRKISLSTWRLYSISDGPPVTPIWIRHPPLSLAAVVVSFFLSVPCVLHATRGVPHCFFHRRPSSSSSSSSPPPPQPQPLVQYPRHHSNPPQGNTDVDDVKLFLNFFIFFSKLKSRQHRSQCPQWMPLTRIRISVTTLWNVTKNN